MANSGRPKVRWARWTIGGAVITSGMAVLWLLFAPQAVSVEVAPVQIGPLAETVADQGLARVREAYVVSAPVSGRLERLDLHVGDRVQAGAGVVARIRPASADLLDPRARAQAQAAVSAAEAAVGAAQAQTEQAVAQARKFEGDLARVRTLADKGFASGQALDAAEAQARVARSALRAAEAQLRVRRAEAVAARAALMTPGADGGPLVEVRSPASGRVTRVLQESERTVPMGAPLVEISDSDGLEAAIEFLSQDAVRIREGMAAEVYDWGGPGVLPAIVRRVEPQGFTKVSALGVEEQRVLVLLQFTGPASPWARLGAGYRVWGRVILRREPRALKAPLGALVRNGGGWAAFRVEDGRARLRSIRLGALTDRDAEVLSGLSAGDPLVVFPSDKVRDGVRVRTSR